MEKVPITVVETGRGEHVETHPAFGMCCLNRTQGVGNLFGTSIQHEHGISMVIKTGERHVSDSRDFYMGGEEMIRIEMSGAQFADMVTGMNIGDGVPCTIIRFNGQSVPTIPDRESFAKEAQLQFHARLKRATEDVSALLKKAESIVSGGAPKASDRKELADMIRQIKMELEQNVPYISECFEERTEKAVSAAKNEVEMFFSARIQSAGLEALGAKAPTLQIGEPGHDNDATR